MQCHEIADLFDSYGDGALSGSLRLEFDAHLVRCGHCRRALAVQEAIAHVVATDAGGPRLSADFAAGVMGHIARRAPQRRTRRRLWIGLAVAAQAAAALVFAAVYLRPQQPGGAGPQPGQVGPAEVELASGIRELIVGKVEDRLWDMHHAGQNFTNQTLQLAQYLNLSVPDEVLRASGEIVVTDPLSTIFEAMVPSPSEAAQPETGEYSL